MTMSCFGAKGSKKHSLCGCCPVYLSPGGLPSSLSEEASLCGCPEAGFAVWLAPVEILAFEIPGLGIHNFCFSSNFLFGHCFVFVCYVF